MWRASGESAITWADIRISISFILLSTLENLDMPVNSELIVVFVIKMYVYFF